LLVARVAYAFADARVFARVLTAPGMLAKILPAGSDCALVPAEARFGALLTVGAGGALAVTVAVEGAGLDRQLCYRDASATATWRLADFPVHIFTLYAADKQTVARASVPLALAGARADLFAREPVGAGGGVDEAFWVPIDLTDTRDAVRCERARAVSNVVRLGANGVGAFVLPPPAAGVSGPSLELCHTFGGGAFRLYPSVRLAVLALEAAAPPRVAVAGVPTQLTFAGAGVGAGDSAVWVAAGAADCAGASSRVALAPGIE
jgi:hypothetical protein